MKNFMVFLGGLFWLSGCYGSFSFSPYVIYTDPMGDFYHSGRFIEESISTSIDEAENSVKMAVYNFDSSAILKALNRAQERGVKVEIVGDMDEADSEGYKALLNEGIDLIWGNTKGIQHNKFIIIDEKVAISGTGNFTHSGFYRNNNNFIFLRDPEVLQRYEKEFLLMHSGVFSSLKKSSLNPLNYNENNVRVFFSPEESSYALSEILKEINLAKDSIYYMIFAFTNDEIGSALAMAAKRGVRIYGIHDVSFSSGSGAEAPFLYKSGLNNKTGPFVHFDGNENIVWINNSFHGGKMHCKTMLIDPESDHPVSITGSFNWSENALENNDENVLLIKDKKVAKELFNEWNTAWGNSNDLSKLADIRPLPESAYHDIVISEISSAGLKHQGSYHKSDDFIEIENKGSKTLDLSSWTLSWETSSGFHAWHLGESSDNHPELIILPGSRKIIYGESGSLLENFNIDPSYLIKVSSTKNFSLPDSKFKVSIYNEKMDLIDRAEVDWPEVSKTQDPVFEESLSLNRREGLYLNKNQWFLSQDLCLYAICQNSRFYMSPGYKNEDEPPPSIKESFFKGPGQLNIKINGPCSLCTPGTFTFFKNQLSESILSGSFESLMSVWSLALASPSFPLDIYSIKTGFESTQGIQGLFISSGRLFITTDHGLYYSDDNGITIVPANLGELTNILSVYKDLLSLKLFIGTSNGVFISQDNGYTFQNYFSSPGSLKDIIYDISSNTSSEYFASAGGLVSREKNTGVITNLSSAPCYAVFSTDSIIISGYEGFIEQINLLTGSVSTIIVQGRVTSIKNIGSTLYVLSSAGLYSSVDSGNSFTFFSYGQTPLEIIQGPSGPLLLTTGGLIDILFSQNFIIPGGNNPFRLNRLVWNGSIFIGAGPLGLYSGPSPELMLPVMSSNIPIRSNFLKFSGFSGEIRAKVEINEISLKTTNSRDWVELFVSEAGNLFGLELGYLGPDGYSIVYRFPYRYAQKGEVILIFMNSGKEEDYKSYLYFNNPTLPFFIYSRHKNPDSGDGIFTLKNGDFFINSVYYSNMDTNIKPDFIKNALLPFFFSENFQKTLGRPLVFPVYQINEIEIQNSGVQIPYSGTNRTIGMVNGTWKIKNPTPGIK